MDFDENRREAPRWPCTGSVDLRKPAAEMSRTGTFSDLSLQGCQIEIPLGSLNVGETMELTFRINGLPFRLLGTVKRGTADGHFGVRFGRMNPRAQWQLKELLAELRIAEVKRVEEARRKEEEERLLKQLEELEELRKVDEKAKFMLALEKRIAKHTVASSANRLRG